MALLKNIKILSVLVVLLSSMENLYSQTEDLPKNQLSLNILSYKFNCEIYPPSLYQFKFLDGITYKRYLKKYSLKVGFEYANNNKNTPEYFQGYTGKIFHTSYKGEETFKKLSLKLGAQKSYNLTKIQIYFGLDIIYTLSHYKMNLTSEGSYENIPSSTTYDVYLDNHWIGLSPIIGVKLKIYKGVSLDAESSYCIKYKIASKGTSKGITPDVFQYFINPLNQLSVSYEF